MVGLGPEGLEAWKPGSLYSSLVRPRGDKARKQSHNVATLVHGTCLSDDSDGSRGTLKRNMPVSYIDAQQHMGNDLNCSESATIFTVQSISNLGFRFILLPPRHSTAVRYSPPE